MVCRYLVNCQHVSNFLTELNATRQLQDLNMLAAHNFEASHFSEILYGPKVIQTTKLVGFLLENILYSDNIQIEELLLVCC